MEWTNVLRSMKTFYSKYSPYPDLFCYWNGNDKTSPINPMSKALDTKVIIRGSIIIVRAEPPKSYSQCFYRIIVEALNLQ
jgi:hypothetical protein